MKEKLIKALLLKNWDENYGIFRPAREYNVVEWLQFITVCVFFYVGIFAAPKLIMDLITEKYRLNELRKMKLNDLEDDFEMTEEEEDA